MLRLERSAMGGVVGDMMLTAVVDKLIDLDVSCSHVFGTTPCGKEFHLQS